jgi:hypothetical protein
MTKHQMTRFYVIVAFVLLTIGCIAVLFRRTPDAELHWVRRAQFVLEELQSALVCFAEKSHGFPHSEEELIQLGCVIRGVSLSPSRNGTVDVSSVEKSWVTLGQILLRRNDLEHPLPPTEVVAIALPDRLTPEVCVVLLQDGKTEVVTKEEWLSPRSQWRTRAAGISLWNP